MRRPDVAGGAGPATLFLRSAGRASSKDIAHHRAFSGRDESTVNAVCTVETRDRRHIAILRRARRQHGFRLR